ncbi:MAG TPA: PspC domain-containing protein [Acidobacteriaceae bacterium]|nr:PspC domain-containing protein [Acidobacteriaceae bacterium]
MPVTCTQCGNAINEDARFCSVCGTAVSAAAPPGQGYSAPAGTVYPAPSRLIRPRYGRMISGVCQGIANNYVWDVVWVRVITVLLAIFGGGIGLIAYLVFWVVMPEEPMPIPQPTAWPPQGNR